MEWIPALAVLLGTSGLFGLVNATAGQWSRISVLERRATTYQNALKGEEQPTLGSAAIRKALEICRLRLAALTMIRPGRYQNLWTVTVINVLLLAGIVSWDLWISPMTSLNRPLAVVTFIGLFVGAVGLPVIFNAMRLNDRRESFVESALADATKGPGEDAQPKATYEQ